MLEYALLGIIQGITEWFPVSSSGHLVLLQHFLSIKSPVFFDALVHLASMFVILIVFRKEIWAILCSPFNPRFKGYRSYWWLIPIGTVPAVAIGLAYRSSIESLFTGISFLGWAFLFTGVVLMLSRFKFLGLRLNPATAFAIGVAQAVALVPGVSRSGMTLSIALILGIKREEAGRFAFLLAIPALGGAFLLQASRLPAGGLGWGVLVGFACAFLVGLLSLRVLLRVLAMGKLHYFSIWCFIIGLSLIVPTLV